MPGNEMCHPTFWWILGVLNERNQRVINSRAIYSSAVPIIAADYCNLADCVGCSTALGWVLLNVFVNLVLWFFNY